MSKIFNFFSILFLVFYFSSAGYAGGDDISVLQEELDMVLMAEYNPCFDQLESDINDNNNITSVIKLSGVGSFNQGDEIISSSNVKAIVESYDPVTNQLTYYQTATTGFRSFLIGDKLVGKGSDVLMIEEFVLDFVVPCSDLIVSIEEDPEQMIFVFAESEAALKAKLAAQETMAEIEAEMARDAALKAFQDKLAADKAAAAKANAAYQSKLARDAEMAARMEELAIEKELAAFEAQLEAELAAQEMMAEIEAEMAAALAEQKIADEIAAFEAQLEAELAAQEMMAEIKAEMAKQAALEAFQQKLADEKAAAAAAQAAYKASQEVVGELVVEEEVIVVTEEAHEACKHALGLTEANIALFESALADGTLFNIGPKSSSGTEFGATRWDAYANCVTNYFNPF